MTSNIDGPTLDARIQLSPILTTYQVKERLLNTQLVNEVKKCLLSSFMSEFTFKFSESAVAIPSRNC